MYKTLENLISEDINSYKPDYFKVGGPNLTLAGTSAVAYRSLVCSNPT